MTNDDILLCSGATIGMQLALPLLQDRLDARALEHKAERAKMAASEIIRMEVSRWQGRPERGVLEVWTCPGGSP